MTTDLLPSVVKYIDVQRLGEGGFGEVYRAVDTALNRAVALKVPHRELLRDPGFAAQFRAEAQIAARLDHPNIVRIYSVGEFESTPFIEMELVEGQTLADLIQAKGCLMPEEALAIIEPVCAALEEAHRKGIIHRDIKPGNILIRASDGRVLVSDFGLAKSRENSFQASLSSSNVVVGTFRYMPPEQANPKLGDVGPRSDVYSLGIVLYEMLTGRAPFNGKSVGQLVYQHTGEEPEPPSNINITLNQAVESVVLKSLQKRPLDRFATASAFVAALQIAIKQGVVVPLVAVTQGATLQTRLESQAEAAHHLKSVAAVQAQADATRKQLEALQQRMEAEKAERARREAEAAQQQAEIARQQQREEAERQRRQAAERAAQRRRLMVGAGIIGALLILVLAAWQPWRERGERGVTPTATTVAVAQLTAPAPTDGDVSGNAPTTSMPPASTTVEPVASPMPKFAPTPSATPLPTDTPAPTFTPTATPTITSTPTATPTHTKSPTPRPSPAITGTPVPSSRAVIVPENAAQIEEVARWDIAGGKDTVAYSPDGKLLAVANDRTVTCYDPTTLAKVYSVTVDDRIGPIAFSPDGSTMALGAGAAVRVWRLGDAAARRVQAEQGSVRAVAISPDGQIVASSSDHVYLWSVADGMLLRSFGPVDNRLVLDLAFMPDGDNVVVGAATLTSWWGSLSAWRVGDGSLVREFEQTPHLYVAVSHDGQSIAAGDDGNTAVWRASDGSRISIEIPRGTIPAFSADDQIIATTDGSAVRLARLSDGLTLRTVQPAYARDLLFSPDGKTLITVHEQYLLFWGIPNR